MRRLDAAAPETVALDGTTFHALFVAEGRATVTANGARAVLAAGASALIPADAGRYTLTPETASSLLVTTL